MQPDIVDAHHHFWRVCDNYCGEWLPEEPEILQRNFLPTALEREMPAAGIGTTILVQAARTEAETEWLLGVMERTPFVTGVVGWVDPLAAGAAARVAAWRARGLVGIRLWNQADPDCTILDAYADAAFFDEVAADLPFDVLIKPQHLPGATRLIARHPDRRYIVDHAAKPNIAAWQPGDADFHDWVSRLSEIAGLADVYCKFSGLVTEASDRWAVNDIRPYYEALLDIFGPDRLVWGSDWPVLLKAGSYRSWIAAAQTLTADLTATERAAIFGGNARGFYRPKK